MIGTWSTFQVTIRLCPQSTGVAHKVISSFCFAYISLHVIALCSPPAFSLFPRRCGQGLHREFRSNDERRPSKFIVLADSMKSAIKMAWEHGGADFQARFDRSSGQAQ